MSDKKLVEILRGSLYPNNADADIQKVIDYCEESHLDPLAGYVNIVPVSIRTGKKDGDGKWIYQRLNVVRPGIGYFRQAALSTGEYLGMEPPVIGPIETLEWEEKGFNNQKERGSIRYPEYVIITVKRLVNGNVATFPVPVYFLETYATKSNWSKAPNSMWAKRPNGQLLKCAEALALRMGFSDRFGAVTSAEEIDGKVIAESEVEAPRVDGLKGSSEQLNKNIQKAKERVGDQQKSPEKPEREAPKPDINIQQLRRELSEVKEQDDNAPDKMRDLKKRINTLAKQDKDLAKAINGDWKRKAEELGLPTSREKTT